MQVILNKVLRPSLRTLFSQQLFIHNSCLFTTAVHSQQLFIRNSHWVLLFPLTRNRETSHQHPLRWFNWYQQEPAADGNGERAVQIRRCPAAVKRLHHGRQSERPPDLQPTRIDS